MGWFSKSKQQADKSKTEAVEKENDVTKTPHEEDDAGGFLKRLKTGLTKTRKNVSGGIDTIFNGKTALDVELIEELEELLITADIGVETSMGIIERMSKAASKKKIKSSDQLKELLKAEIVALLSGSAEKTLEITEKPHVVMVVGVNGVGKTTTIGKLAAKAGGENVLICAADTFRAAASEQLEIWAKRANADIVKHKDGSDPAAVAFDGVQAAIARKKKLVFIDTAGRLHTKVNLMEELKKIKRSVAKKMPSAPHETLLVLDATTGQNAISQAELFHEAIGVTGIALTKVDGTAKGGIVINICNTLHLPLQYIGVGEKLEDLQAFNPNDFVDAMF